MLAGATCAGLSACAAPSEPEFLGAETTYLDPALLNVVAQMSRAASEEQVMQYVRCVTAGRTLVDELDFARHVRTKTTFNSGIWRADAVYTISAGMPPGLHVLDAKKIAAECVENGIPIS